MLPLSDFQLKMPTKPINDKQKKDESASIIEMICEFKRKWNIQMMADSKFIIQAMMGSIPSSASSNIRNWGEATQEKIALSLAFVTQMPILKVTLANLLLWSSVSNECKHLILSLINSARETDNPLWVIYEVQCYIEMFIIHLTHIALDVLLLQEKAPSGFKENGDWGDYYNICRFFLVEFVLERIGPLISLCGTTAGRVNPKLVRAHVRKETNELRKKMSVKMDEVRSVYDWLNITKHYLGFFDPIFPNSELLRVESENPNCGTPDEVPNIGDCSGSKNPDCGTPGEVPNENHDDCLGSKGYTSLSFPENVEVSFPPVNTPPSFDVQDTLPSLMAKVTENMFEIMKPVWDNDEIWKSGSSSQMVELINGCFDKESPFKSRSGELWAVLAALRHLQKRSKDMASLTAYEVKLIFWLDANLDFSDVHSLEKMVENVHREGGEWVSTMRMVGGDITKMNLEKAKQPNQTTSTKSNSARNERTTSRTPQRKRKDSSPKSTPFLTQPKNSKKSQHNAAQQNRSPTQPKISDKTPKPNTMAQPKRPKRRKQAR